MSLYGMILQPCTRNNSENNRDDAFHFPLIFYLKRHFSTLKTRHVLRWDRKAELDKLHITVYVKEYGNTDLLILHWLPFYR